MDIPEGIKKEIVSYVRLEFGEDSSDPDALQESDLKYEGEFIINGVPTHYWRCGDTSRTWATVEPFGDSYCLGMTSSSPKPVFKKNLYSHLEVEEVPGKVSERIELQSFGDRAVGLPSYKEVCLSDGEVVEVLAEAHLENSPVSVTVSIEENQKNCYVRASEGIAMSYTTSSGKQIILTIGTGPWE